MKNSQLHGMARFYIGQEVSVPQPKNMYYNGHITDIRVKTRKNGTRNVQYKVLIPILKSYSIQEPAYWFNENRILPRINKAQARKSLIQRIKDFLKWA